ncbi:MAG: Kef-type K+ transport system membrane component KefB [Candidatus Paceibacteria bacterium]|jgi:Kef-type K+ transport system membrane component KefB
MTELLPFFIVLFAGLFFSEFFFKFHVPWVVSLIIGGVIIGPSGFNVFVPNETILFLGEIGLIFLMFMAGLGTNLIGSQTRQSFDNVISLALLNSVIPFLVGLGIGIFFDLGTTTSLLLGTIFVSSSIAVIIPSLEANNLLRCGIGRSIMLATIFSDVASLILLSILLQSTQTLTFLPLPIFYAILIVVVVGLKTLIPKLLWYFSRNTRSQRDIFQQELRSIFVILIGTVVSFQLLGLHPIIAGFFAGVVMSQIVKGDIIKEKLRGLSYGFFIPIFFIVVGSQADLSVIFKAKNIALLTAVVVLGTVLSKFISGYVGGRLNKFKHQESLIIGASTIPQLSTTLAVSFAGRELGIIPDQLLASLVILVLVTTILGPILVKFFSRKYIREEVNFVCND